MTDPEAIAATLSEAQKRAVINLPQNGSYADEYTSPPWPNIHMRAELGPLGRMRPNTRFRHGYALTPLGLAVRAILQGERRG